MTPYTETLTLTLPEHLADIAAAIGRAMDPDLGGADSFHRPVTGYTEEGEPLFGDTLVCSTLCTPQFKAAALQMMADTSGQALHAFVEQDYSRRWADLTPPTLEDCAAFVGGLQVVVPTVQTSAPPDPEETP